MNRLRMEGDQQRINELLESVKGEDNVLDFNKIIPMPRASLVCAASVRRLGLLTQHPVAQSLKIESGSRTVRGLKAYRDFVYVYTFAGTEQKDLLNIPKEKEEIFLRERPEIRRDEWELGRTAFQNEQKYGAPRNLTKRFTL